MQNLIKAFVASMSAAMVCTAVIMGFPGGMGASSCQAKESDVEKEVVDFVTSYYEAHTPEGIDTLADYVSNPEGMDFQMFLVSLKTTFERGVTGWENISVAAYPLSDGEHWIASVSSEMVVRDFDVALPGLKVELIDRDTDGDLHIMTGSEELDEKLGEDVADALLKEIQEISLSDEMVDRNNEIVIKYNEIIADNSDVNDWLVELSMEIDKAKTEAYDQIGQSLYGGKEAGEDKPDKKGNHYVVKKGDCLWTIAEEQLGDGMRWSDIYETNKAVIGEDPNLIYVGIELELK